MSFGVSQATGLQGLPNQYLSMNFANTAVSTSISQWTDDFIGQALDEYRWKKNGSGTCTTPAQASSVGLLKLSSGAVNLQEAYVNFNGSTTLSGFNSSKKPEYEFGGIYVNSAAACKYRVGLVNAIANKFIYLECDPVGRANANWWLCRNNAAAADEVDTGIAPDTTGTARQCFRFVSNSSTSLSVYYKQQGSTASQSSYTLVGTYTSNLPAGLVEPWIYTQSQGGADKIIYCDYFTQQSARVNL